MKKRPRICRKTSKYTRFDTNEKIARLEESIEKMKKEGYSLAVIMGFELQLEELKNKQKGNKKEWIGTLKGENDKYFN